MPHVVMLVYMEQNKQSEVWVLGEAVTHTNIPHTAACNHRKHNLLNSVYDVYDTMSMGALDSLNLTPQFTVHFATY